MTLHKRIPPLRPSRNLPSARIGMFENGVAKTKIVNTMLPCVAVGAHPDGLLPVEVANTNLVVQIPVDPSSPVFDDGSLGTLQLMWKGNPYGTPYQIGAADMEKEYIELEVDASELVDEGISPLTYTGLTFPGGDEYIGTPTLNIEVDRTPPGGENIAALSFSQDVIDDGVTPAKLDAEGNLPSMAAHWRELKLGDKLHPILVRGADEVTVDPIEVIDDTPGVSIPVFFPRDKLEQIGDGRVDFTFVLEDRAGNRSIRAPGVTLDVLLSSVPRNWPEPGIPLAPPPNRSVGDEQARAPVGVDIPADSNFQIGDMITVYWGAEKTVPEAVTDPAEDPIMTMFVPYSAVQAAGDGAIAVVYRVERNGIDIGVSEPVVTVNVDLTLPGGPDPDPETPGHGNLLQATVTADSGATDRISAEDFGKHANITVLHEGIDGTALFEVDDIVTIYWGTTALEPHTIVAADTDKSLVLPLTGEEMEAEGAGEVVLYYTIARKLANNPGESNTSRSPDKPIEVISSAELPGGGNPDTGSFPEANSQNAINSEAAASGGGTPFRISVYTNMAVGDYIEFRFIAFDGYGAAANEVPASEHTGNRRISSDDVARGHYEFVVPSAKLYLAGRPGGAQEGRGRAVATYAITNDKGTGNGNPVNVLIDARPLP
ncbi:hypothetical protein ACIQSO_03695 [Pseudomonas putida]|uniref:hypothetical protein n=1 Tax=Pseudomonas putida TaxID=303 RepID=UPI00383A62F3